MSDNSFAYYHHPQYLRARADAFARSDGMCQFCGQRTARHAHHWAMNYPAPEALTGDDLTALCRDCHLLATTVRRFQGGITAFMAAFRTSGVVMRNIDRKEKYGMWDKG